MTDEAMKAAAEAAYTRFNESLFGCCEPVWSELPETHRERLTLAMQAAVAAFLREWEPSGLEPPALVDAVKAAARAEAERIERDG